jgi:hypothetical protein
LTVLGGISNSVAISRMVQPFVSMFDYRKIFNKKLDKVLDKSITLY